MALNDIDPEWANKAVESIKHSIGGSFTALAGDIGSVSLIYQMLDSAIAQFGKIDIVIANSGITLFGDFFTYPPESFSREMQVNLAGTFFLAQAAAKKMKKQETGGSLLFTSSVIGHQAHKQLAAYGMSKALQQNAH